MDNKRTVGFELRSLNNLIRRDIEKNHPAELDCTKGVHGLAIGYFYHNRDKDIFQKDFEEHFSIRRSTATQILKLMEKRGYITRQSVDYDARLKKIVLTNKAMEINKIIRKDIDNREQRLTQGLSDDEIESFLNIIEKMKANLEAKND